MHVGGCLARPTLALTRQLMHVGQAVVLLLLKLLLSFSPRHVRTRWCDCEKVRMLAAHLGPSSSCINAGSSVLHSHTTTPTPACAMVLSVCTHAHGTHVACVHASPPKPSRRSQAATARQNYLAFLKLGRLGQGRHGKKGQQGSDSDDDDDSDEGSDEGEEGMEREDKMGEGGEPPAQFHCRWAGSGDGAGARVVSLRGAGRGGGGGSVRVRVRVGGWGVHRRPACCLCWCNSGVGMLPLLPN